MRRLRLNSNDMRKYQEKKLRTVIRNAYTNVPFYHELYKKAGIHPSDINGLADLSKLPIVRKDVLKSEDPRRLVSSEFDLNNLKVVRTSGSSGKPFQIYINRREDDWRKAIYMRANISCGQKMRDRWVVVTAPHHFTDTSPIQRKLGFFAQTCVSVFKDMDEQITEIDEAKPNVLDGYSGSLVLLAKEVQRKGVATIKPRLTFGTAELIDDASMRLIEEVFEAPYYDQFGCAEVDRSAWQCPEKVGYHMDCDSVITQFVDADGHDVSAGERGEVVYTSLFNQCMPFIRYNIGDVGVPSDEKCPCPRNLPLMKVIEGRKDSLLILPNGQVLSPRIFTNAMSMFSMYGQIEQFQLVQKNANLLKVYVKQKKDSNLDYFEERLAEHLARMLRLESSNVSIEVEVLEDMPKDQTGKHRAVYSELKPQRYVESEVGN